jgi:hypothetical protein
VLPWLAGFVAKGFIGVGFVMAIDVRFVSDVLDLLNADQISQRRWEISDEGWSPLKW